MTDVVQRLWGFAHNLRHDGVDYGDFIEQITYLLFLKMADEQEIAAPEGHGLAVPARAEWRCADRALRGRAAHARQATGHARRHLRRQPEPAGQPGDARSAHQVDG